MRARWANLWNVPEALSFIIANRVKGNLDPGIFQYPTTRILRVENGQNAALLYMPVHTGTILESVGWGPELSAGDKLQAGIVAIEGIERESWEAGIREIFFICSDQRTDELCQKLGYEKVTCMRKRITYEDMVQSSL